MGCCQSREVILRQKPIDQNSPKQISNLMNQAKTLNIKPIEEGLDSRSYDLVRYVEELNTTAKWETVKDDNFYSIKSVRGSKFDQICPVSKVVIKTEGTISLKLLVDVLTSPEKRTAWDDAVSSYEIVDGKYPDNYISYQTSTLLSFKNDFITKNFIRTYEDKLYIISYDVEHEKKPDLKAITRGIIYMNVIVISLTGGNSEIAVFNQTDLKNTLGKISADQRIQNLDKWVKKLNKELNTSS